MQRVLLQRCVLAFVLLLGGVSIVSSLSSCRVNDILNPSDTTLGGGGNHGGNGGRDTTSSRDSNITTDTTIVNDTTRNQIVINGDFMSRGGFPEPWTTWWLGSPSSLSPKWDIANGCGMGQGSMLFPMTGGAGIWEELGAPISIGKTYLFSACVSAAADANGVCEPAEIKFFGSSDDGLTMEEIGKMYTNSPGWGSQSFIMQPQSTYTSLFIEVEPLNRTQTDGWTGLDNLSIVTR